MRRVSLVLFSCLLSSLTFAQSSEQQRDRDAIDQLTTVVRFLADRNLFCISNKDCRVIAMGSRACGGPSGFAVTSKYNPNLAEVEELAQKVTEKETEYNLRYDVVSTCIVAVPPSPKCVWRKCR